MRRLSPLAALLITLALSAALAAACGGDADDQRAPQAQEQTAAIEAVEQAAPPEQPQHAAAVQGEAGQRGQSVAGVSGGTEQQTERQAGPRQGAAAQRSGDRTDGRIVAPQPLDTAYALARLREIAEEIGPRSVGRLGERRMVDFLGEALRGDGYEVAIEPFDFVGAPAGHTVAIVSQLGGAATMSVTVPVALMERSPDVLTAGRIVVVPGVGTAADFASVETEGAAAVVQRGELTFSEKQRNAEAAGAVALFVVDPDGPFSGVLTADEPGEIPVFALPPGLGERLRENEGETATIGVREDVIFESWNVVARRPGGECRVVVGGHYDSVPQVQGANDNASGIGITLALARAWAGASSADYVCFVGFGAEELGLHGSHAFVGRRAGIERFRGDYGDAQPRRNRQRATPDHRGGRPGAVGAVGAARRAAGDRCATSRTGARGDSLRPHGVPEQRRAGDLPGCGGPASCTRLRTTRRTSTRRCCAM